MTCVLLNSVGDIRKKNIIYYSFCTAIVSETKISQLYGFGIGVLVRIEASYNYMSSYSIYAYHIKEISYGMKENPTEITFAEADAEVRLRITTITASYISDPYLNPIYLNILFLI